MKKTPLIMLAALAAITLGLAGCSNGGAEASTTTPSNERNLPAGDEITTTADPKLVALLPDDVAEKGKLDVTVEIPYPPMSMFGENNREIGFDPELGRLIAQKLDLDISLNKGVFDTAVASLQAGKNDMIMMGMNDTPERQKTLSFVNYTHGGFAIVVKAGNPDSINTQSDLCGKTVSVQKATVQGDLLRAMDCGVNVMELPADLDAVTALRAGKSSAYVADAIPARYIAETTDDGATFDIVQDAENPRGFDPVYSGIGILKDRTELVEAVRAALESLIEEGSYEKLTSRYDIQDYGVEEAQVNQGTATS
ncbi:Probable solute binding protein of ABC transporter system [Leucobacter sp. 7(1)]|uniref:transporter substrate-binding domain-containing protein n=1 Tax=Leucobacter sp. 7(1) TaxID=1255613 RepID=UPI00097F6968|nr:transporter substrate-binding domain-containing protein [Leucobacter sp. 7(1)]SJN09081.1 Probable solute binding protein of ABC transporter system [Leucobacter sp. 7(1)]